MDECIRRAMGVPSAVTLAQRDRAIADHDRLQSRSAFLPQSAVSSGYSYNSPSRRDPANISFVALNGVREFTALASVLQEIDTSGRLRADYARARASQDAAAASVAIANRDLRRLVSAAYYRLLLARHLEDALRATLAESEHFEERARKLAEQGEAARADVVKAAASAMFLRQALGTAALASELANQELASFWTRDVATKLSIVDILERPLPAPEEVPAAGTAYLRRFEFKLLEARERGFSAEARMAKANLLPHVTAGFQYGLDTALAPAWRDRGYAAVANVTFPVFDWFRSINASKQFQARAAQVVETRAISERTFSQEYWSSLARAKQYYSQVEICRGQVALAEEDSKLSRVRYEGGEGAAVDVVVAQTQLAQARTNYYFSIANYLNALLDLEVASGR